MKTSYNGTSTTHIIRTSFKAPIDHYQVFIKKVGFFFLPIILFRYALNFAGILDISYMISRYVAILIPVLLIPFDISMIIEANKISKCGNPVESPRKNILKLYFPFVTLLFTIELLSTFIQHKGGLSFVTYRLIPALIDLSVIPLKVIGIIFTQIALFEKLTFKNVWTRSIQIIKRRWETYIILVILYGLCVWIANVLINFVSTKSYVFKSTAYGDDISIGNIFLYLIVALLYAYLYWVRRHGFLLYYSSIAHASDVSKEVTDSENL